MASSTGRSRKHAEIVHGYDDTYLACRDLRHVWQLVGFYRSNGSVRRVLDCGRCGTQRADTWKVNGERVSSAYSYVEGYQVPDGGMDSFEVRKEVLTRATIYKDERDMVAALTTPKSTKLKRGRR